MRGGVFSIPSLHLPNASGSASPGMTTSSISRCCCVLWVARLPPLESHWSNQGPKPNQGSSHWSHLPPPLSQSASTSPCRPARRSSSHPLPSPRILPGPFGPPSHSLSASPPALMPRHRPHTAPTATLLYFRSDLAMALHHTWNKSFLLAMV